MDSLKTMEPVPNVPPDAQLVQLLRLVTLVVMSEETQSTIAHVLLDSMMPELTNVPLAAQVVPHVQVLPLVHLVKLQNSDPSTTLFVSAKKDTSNLFSKTEPEFAPSVHQNARLALKVPLNAQVVMSV